MIGIAGPCECRWTQKEYFMNMSDSESNQQDIIVTRPDGEEMRLAPTICVEDVDSMGDVEDEEAEEGQGAHNSSCLFMSNKVRPRPDDNQGTQERLLLSTARSASLCLL